MAIRASKGSLAAMLVDDLGVELDGPEFNSAFEQTILYLTGVSSAFEHQSYLKQFCDKRSQFSAKDLRLRVAASEHIYAVKMLSLRLSIMRSPDLSDARQLASEFKVRASDYRRVLSLFQRRKSIRSFVREVAFAVPGESLTHSNTESLFSYVYKGVNVYTRSLVYRKLRFVARSQNMTLDELTSDVMAKVVQAYYKLVPTAQCDDYVGNYLRRSAHNHIMNMIHSATSKKRGRLINTGKDVHGNDTFNLLVASENQLNVNSLDGEEVRYDELSVDTTESERLTLRISVNQLMKNAGADRTKVRFLKILMGAYSRRFSQWLRDNKIAKPAESNIDVQDRTTAPEFMDMVRRYLKLTKSHTKYLVSDIKHSLGGDSNVACSQAA